MLTFLLWCILLIFCWPLALVFLVLYPIVWLLLLPFRILGIAVERSAGAAEGYHLSASASASRPTAGLVTVVSRSGARKKSGPGGPLS